MINKILITGGHAGSTAYSFIQEIQKKEPGWKIVFVGSKRAVEGKNVPTLEFKYFPKLGIKYIAIRGGRIQRKLSRWTIPSILKIPLGFYDAYCVLASEKPDIVVSFGGYIALPIIIISWLKRIPVVVHEQTAAAGRVNILSAFFADKIAISRIGSTKYFPKQKCELIGNPISTDVISCKRKNTERDLKSILITGGSRGASVINENVAPIMKDLLKKYRVYHQTGEIGYQKYKELKNSLEYIYRERYTVFPIVEMSKMSSYFEKADILVSRAGANTVSELVYLGIPSVLIPLPYNYLDEQFQNALYAKSLGIAEIITQNKLTPQVLYEKIEYISKNWRNIVKSSKRPEIDDSKASAKLLRLISEYA